MTNIRKVTISFVISIVLLILSLFDNGITGWAFLGLGFIFAGVAIYFSNKVKGSYEEKMNEVLKDLKDNEKRIKEALDRLEQKSVEFRKKSKHRADNADKKYKDR